MQISYRIISIKSYHIFHCIRSYHSRITFLSYHQLAAYLVALDFACNYLILIYFLCIYFQSSYSLWSADIIRFHDSRTSVLFFVQYFWNIWYFYTVHYIMYRSWWVTTFMLQAINPIGARFCGLTHRSGSLPKPCKRWGTFSWKLQDVVSIW